MDKEEALEIISMIIDGLDPFDEDDPSKKLPEINPVTMRAVCTVIMSLLSGEDRKNLKSKYKTKKLAELIESASGPLELYLKGKEKDKILKALFDAKYNLQQAAQKLGITHEELIKKIDIHQMGEQISVRFLWIVVEADFLELFEQGYWYKRISLDEYLEILERNAIQKALEKTNFNKTTTAEKLGITFRSFRYKLDKFRIEINLIGYNLDDRVKTDYFIHFQSKSLGEFIKSVEKKMLELALQKTDNNITSAAELLGISFRSLRYRIDHLDIKAN